MIFHKIHKSFHNNYQIQLTINKIIMNKKIIINNNNKKIIINNRI